MIIAVDGPVAAGKGTLARRLARDLGFAHLDTGLIYRAVGALLLQAGQEPENAEAARLIATALGPEDLARDDLRREAVGRAASVVAAHPAVRTALLGFQRNFAENPPGGRPGAVLDGRDIGTVVCPGAPVKLFVTAEVEARARRRHKELLERGEESIYARVLEDLRERDARDSERLTAPLKPAPDATVLDTTEMTIEAAVRAAMEIIERRRSARKAD